MSRLARMISRKKVDTSNLDDIKRQYDEHMEKVEHEHFKEIQNLQDKNIQEILNEKEKILHQIEQDILNNNSEMTEETTSFVSEMTPPSQPNSPNPPKSQSPPLSGKRKTMTKTTQKQSLQKIFNERMSQLDQLTKKKTPQIDPIKTTQRIQKIKKQVAQTQDKKEKQKWR